MQIAADGEHPHAIRILRWINGTGIPKSPRPAIGGMPRSYPLRARTYFRPTPSGAASRHAGPAPPAVRSLPRRRSLPTRASALPMAVIEVPAVSAMLPMIRSPCVTAAFMHPVSLVPDVPMSIPSPVARRPDVADAWRRHGLDDHRRRTDADVEIDVRPRRRDRRRRSHGYREQQRCAEVAKFHGVLRFPAQTRDAPFDLASQVHEQ